jgi:hypothetical protein
LLTAIAAFVMRALCRAPERLLLCILAGQALAMVEENEKAHMLKIAELQDELRAEAADLED